MQIEFKEEKTKTTAGLCTYDTLSVEFMALDLASMKSVQTFINDFTAKESHLNLLICNAGIAICGQGTYVRRYQENEEKKPPKNKLYVYFTSYQTMKIVFVFFSLHGR